MTNPLALRSLRPVLTCLALAAFGCSAAPTHAVTSDGGARDGFVDAGPVYRGTPATFNVFDEIPQFGVYDNTQPNYTPPAGVVMWSYGTVFVTQLGAMQQDAIGADLAARVTFFAQCDNYDRLGGLFFLSEPKGQAPQPTDARTEIVRFITPFSDYQRGARAKLVYPDADISAFAQALADPSRDVWVGIAGGSNPYGGDPCTNAAVTADFAAVGFKYSVDFVSTKPLPVATSVVLTAVADVSESSTPITGIFTNPGAALAGHVTVIISGHGSGAGGDEYENTNDTLTINGATVGSFDTMIDCSPFAAYSPDGNPAIFQDNGLGNPRNWCPGALVPSYTFPVKLVAGANPVSLAVDPPDVPSGSYYPTSITFTSP